MTSKRRGGRRFLFAPPASLRACHPERSDGSASLLGSCSGDFTSPFLCFVLQPNSAALHPHVRTLAFASGWQPWRSQRLPTSRLRYQANPKNVLAPSPLWNTCIYWRCPVKLRFALSMALALAGLVAGALVLLNTPVARAAGCNPPCHAPKPYCCIPDGATNGYCTAFPCQ